MDVYHYETDPVFAAAIEAHGLDIHQLKWTKEKNPIPEEDPLWYVESFLELENGWSSLLLRKDGSGTILWDYNNQSLYYCLEDERLLTIGETHFTETLLSVMRRRKLSRFVDIPGGERLFVKKAYNVTLPKTCSVDIELKLKPLRTKSS